MDIFNISCNGICSFLRYFYEILHRYTANVINIECFTFSPWWQSRRQIWRMKVISRLGHM